MKSSEVFATRLRAQDRKGSAIADCVATLNILDAVWTRGLVAPWEKWLSEKPSPR